MEVLNRKWERVYRWILAYIDRNKFSENLKLPSENDICRYLKVSRDTVRCAMKQLEKEGLIRRVQGSGTYFNKDVSMSAALDSGTAERKIGLILQGQDGDAEAELIRGIRSVIKDDQVDLWIFLTDNKFANERRCLQTVMHQDFQGFIVDGVKASMASPNLDCYQEIQRRGIPVIFFNNYYQNLHCPRVGVNNNSGAKELIRLLVSAGHRDIAGIFVYDNYQSVEKFQGMFAALLSCGIEFRDDYIKWCISNEAHDERFARSIWKFLKSVPRATAIVCCNYRIYRLVRQVLQMQGKRVPLDYSMVCFDYSAEGKEQEGITCSVYQGYKIGCRTAELLIRMIERGERGNRDYSLILRPEIYIGNSIKQMGDRTLASEQ